jgi:hypothetical protein
MDYGGGAAAKMIMTADNSKPGAILGLARKTALRSIMSMPMNDAALAGAGEGDKCKDDEMNTVAGVKIGTLKNVSAEALERLAAVKVVNPHIVTEDEDSTMSKFGNHTAESYLLGVTLIGFLFE